MGFSGSWDVALGGGWHITAFPVALLLVAVVLAIAMAARILKGG
jgi:hypothetical protein